MEFTSVDKEKYIKTVTEKLAKEALATVFNAPGMRDEEEFSRLIGRMQGNNHNVFIDELESPLEIDEEVLGGYTPMSSPGVVSIKLGNMIDLFMRTVYTVVHAGYSITLVDLKNLAEITVRKTLFHEYFHHFSDIQLHLNPFTKDHNTEEALAVAWSKYKVDEFIRSRFKKTIPLFETFLKKVYNYSSPGYRDWKLYNIESNFFDKVIDYVYPSSAGILLRNGVDLHSLLKMTLNDIYDSSKAIKFVIDF